MHESAVGVSGESAARSRRKCPGTALRRFEHERYSVYAARRGVDRIDPALLTATAVATPHVAGYSDDGKRNGTRMVYEAFCAWAGLTPHSMTLPAAPPELLIDAGEDSLARALEVACFVERHDRAMRELAGLEPAELAANFDRLRRDYPSRRDFQALQVRCEDAACRRKLGRLGFQVKAA